MFKKAAFLLTMLAIIALKKNKSARLPLIGEEAPSFKANSTQGYINFPQDFRENWVILFSHPADFTPVCTTEFMTFESMKDEFEELNTKLVGLSVDSVNSHNAWLKTIEDKIEYGELKNLKIDFPLIEDLKGEIAKKYGMIQPKADDTKTVRAVFIIDPKGIIRAILYYPLTNGRNIREIKRLLIAMQATDEFGIATPANWTIGDDVILPPPTSAEGIQLRLSEQSDEIHCYDWFMCFKKLPHDTVMEKVIIKRKCEV